MNSIQLRKAFERRKISRFAGLLSSYPSSCGDILSSKPSTLLRHHKQNSISNILRRTDPVLRPRHVNEILLKLGTLSIRSIWGSHIRHNRTRCDTIYSNTATPPKLDVLR